ncbi:MAG: proteasome accessory factor PafA2 family protein [Nitrospiraceae bacterium]
MLNKIFGLETEYGLLVKQDRPDHSSGWYGHRLRDYVFHKEQRGVLDVHHRGHDEPPGNGGFLTNGGRIYIDMGHLEFASPECGTLADIVASDRAGDALLQGAITALGLDDHIALIKNNIDHETDATFGCHENYLVSRRFPFSRRGLGKLLPHLVTRQLFTGAGRVGMAAVQDVWMQRGQIIVPRGAMFTQAASHVPFQLSQRADHIVNDFFEWVQGNRAIVNTRDEPLADPNEYRRIHLLVGDTNMAEYATALKLGTTALVLQLIEEGYAPDGLQIAEPVEALQELSQDQERRWIVQLESGRTISAIDLQVEYLAEAKAHFAGQDDETDWVLREWEQVLEDLRGDYRRLVGRVDWASKLWMLETYREAEGVGWDDPMLKSLDLEYHNLNPASGLYLGLLEEGKVPRLTTDRAIELAMSQPPRDTRAFGRSEVVRHLLACSPREAGMDPLAQAAHDRLSPAYVINWSAFQLRGRDAFLMPNPFRTYVQDVRQHLGQGVIV